MKTNAGKPVCHFPASARPLRQFVRIGARSAWQGALLGLCAVWVFQVEAWAGWNAARPWDTKSVGALKDLRASVALEKPARRNPKLDSSLTELLEAYYRGGPAEAQSFGARHMLAVHDGRVQVEMEVLPEAMDDVRKAIEVAGGEYQGHYKTLVQALVPISSLESLAQRSDVLFMRQPRRAIPLAISEGVGAANATTWHAAGYDGSGVKVAIIDGGFDGYTSYLGTDLPASVTARDYTGEGMGGDVHGTACSEIVHDMAPGAQMYLSKVYTVVELASAIDDLIEDGVQIISMSEGWPLDGPGDGTGTLADIVKDARSHGIFYAVAAGNYARTSWSGQYVDDSSAPGTHQWPNGGNVNVFGPDPEDAYVIPVGERINVILHWDDWTTVKQDYDLYLLEWMGSSWAVVASSTGAQNGGAGQKPEEGISYTVEYSAVYGVAVRRYSATRNVCFRVMTDLYDLQQRVEERSLFFPADSPDAITVGAVDVNAPYPLESYSSQGPTFGPGGACTGGSTKPDIVAYDNVSTESYGPEAFPGTSAAAPHVAGAAALVKQLYPSFTVSQLQSYLESNAIDQGVQGKDNLYGSGRLYLPVPTPRPSCTGDCGNTGTITVADIITMIDIALGTVQLSACTAGDANGDQLITVDEILQAVNNALNGCQPPPTSTPASPATGTPTPTPTPQGAEWGAFTILCCSNGTQYGFHVTIGNTTRNSVSSDCSISAATWEGYVQTSAGDKDARAWGTGCGIFDQPLVVPLQAGLCTLVLDCPTAVARVTFVNGICPDPTTMVPDLANVCAGTTAVGSQYRSGDGYIADTVILELKSPLIQEQSTPQYIGEEPSPQ